MNASRNIVVSTTRRGRSKRGFWPLGFCIAFAMLAAPATAYDSDAGSDHDGVPDGIGTAAAAVLQAEPNVPVVDEPVRRRFTRRRAVLLGLTSTFFGLGSVVVDYIPGPSILNLRPNSYYQYLTEIAASAPLLAVSPVDAAEVGGLQVALVAASLGLRYGGALQSGSNLYAYWNSTEGLSLHQGIYAAYATYRDARADGSSEAWHDAWRPWTADELIVAPLQSKNLGHPVVLVPLSLAVLSGGIAVGTYYGMGQSFPSTGARDAALLTLSSWNAGVTEEALFRGFVYEELQLSLGRAPARLIDMTLFAAAHLPGEVGLGQSTAQIAEGVVVRAILGFFCEAAYDQGGLPESVAFHALWDTTLALAAALTGTHPLGGGSVELGAPRSESRRAGPVLPLASASFVF